MGRSRDSKLMWIAGFAAIAALALPGVACADSVPPAVVAKKVGAGWVFTDQKGMSLYTYAQDKPGLSQCVGACAIQWPPLLAASDTETQGLADWSLVDRGEGKKQIAFRGMPLYRYAKDPAPGTTFGDGVAVAWHLALHDMPTPPGIHISRNEDGRALTDARGRTLYVNVDDKPKAAGDKSGGNTLQLTSACTKRCMEYWTPLIAPLAAVAAGDWSIAEREDGLRQWAYRQKALYVPTGTVAPSDRAWRAAIVEAPPAVPSWVTYQATDGGELVADPAGFTVYALVQNAVGGQYGSPLMVCDAACTQKFWRPVVAAPDAKPVGNWTIVETADGTRQWAYRGELLFTHTRDTAPGEIAGSRFFTRAWHTLTRSGRIMEGMDRS